MGVWAAAGAVSGFKAGSGTVRRRGNADDTQRLLPVGRPRAPRAGESGRQAAILSDMPVTALLIAHQPEHLASLRRALGDMAPDWQLHVVGTAQAAREWLREREAGLVVAMSDLPSGSLLGLGLDWSAWPALMCVPPGREAEAAQALRQGFSDYLILDPAGGWLHTFPEQVRALLTKAEMQHSLTESAQRLAMTLDAVDMGLWDRDLRTGEGSMDAHWVAMLGYEPGELNTDVQARQALTHPDDLLRVAHARQLAIQGDTDIFEVDFRMRHKDGHWVWINTRGRVVERAPDGTALRMMGTHTDISARKNAEVEFARQHRLLQAISRVQNEFIVRRDSRQAFDALLHELIDVTESGFGLVGEVVREPGREVYLLIRAMTDISWDDASRARYAAMEGGGMVFDNLDGLIGATLRSGQAVISRDPANDPRGGGTPAGHPPMHNYLGLPVMVDGRLVGQIGLANAPDGYSEADVAFLEPLLSAVGQMFRARELDRERHQALEALEVTHESIAQGILRIGPDGRVSNYNRRVLDLLNLPEELLAGRPEFHALVAYQKAHGEFGERFELVDTQGRDYVSDMARLDSSDPRMVPPDTYWRRTARGTVLEVRTRQLPDGGMVRTFADVTEYLNAQEKLRNSQSEVLEASNRLQAVLDAIPDPLFEMNDEGRYLYIYCNNPELLARPPAELLGRCFHEVLPPEAALVVRDALDEARRDGLSIGRQYRLPLGDTEHWFELSVTRKRPLAGEADRYVMLAHDITGRKQAEREIERLAFHDVLTGLPNRRLLLDRLAMALAASTRAHQHGALLFIDLDNFKDLNDTLGHDRGDLLLQQVAERLREAVRETDTVARLGGDEFVVMLEGLAAHEAEAAVQAEAVARKLLSVLNQPYRLTDKLHNSTPSMGVALFGHAGDTVDELLKRADLAMYRAKIEGRNTLRFFDPEMQAAVLARASLEADLRLGLQRDELELHFQPVVDAQGALTGAEALVRWRHPQRGMVSPAEFIPVAEQSGLIIPLGQWVLSRACEHLLTWRDDPRLACLSLSVNVSAREFLHPDFVRQVVDLLQGSGVDPARLKLELTESMFLHDTDDIIERMNTLRGHGVHFSLDDFGTGYSSLSYLKRLPLDQLKIDQSFVRDVLDDPDDAAIVRAILTLAKSLDLSVVAEGVETEGQRDFLALSGCTAFQGYWFGRPGPDIRGFLPRG